MLLITVKHQAKSSQNLTVNNSKIEIRGTFLIGKFEPVNVTATKLEKVTNTTGIYSHSTQEERR